MLALLPLEEEFFLLPELSAMTFLFDETALISFLISGLIVVPAVSPNL